MAATPFTRVSGDWSVSVCGYLRLEVAVAGVPAPVLQWELNGVELTGECGPVLRVSDFEEDLVGVYTYVASNASGSVKVIATKRTFPGKDIAAISAMTLHHRGGGSVGTGPTGGHGG